MGPGVRRVTKMKRVGTFAGLAQRPWFSWSVAGYPIRTSPHRTVRQNVTGPTAHAFKPYLSLTFHAPTTVFTPYLSLTFRR